MEALRKPTRPIQLYSMTYSGHGHRVQLFLSILNLPFEKIDIDPTSGDLHKPDFLARNPFGQVPLIIDDDVVIFDSNAILVYLAKKYAPDSWLPTDPAGSAAVQQWFSLAAGQIAFGPCAARRLKVYNEELVPMGTAVGIATKLFRVLDGILSKTAFAVGDRPTLADISAYTYIAHAPEGGLSLDPYPNIKSWIRLVESLPGFVPMSKAPSAQ